ncbi:hypothetical protein [Pseudomonas fulva]|uniref:hypothetical protein n=1 Tax=Pseudomonas fulva TaxID=47880 RepID=UPI0018AAE449|nr:hypothetical protein [Pseudomonas fulva]MBF8679517.1 hypothetical protein [Pseudomonas fulva]MBF8718093.1 hypothetical protein [Pseudomonas fulva]MBF8784474.1 hypothetical protein [Pseudomonas fulva]
MLVSGTHSSLNTVLLDVLGGGLKVNQRNKAWSRQGSTKAANGLRGPGWPLRRAIISRIAGASANSAWHATASVFAAYGNGESHVYELWPLDSHGRRLDSTLKEQRGWTTSLAKRWTSRRALPDFLWKLQGLDPTTLEEGASVHNAQLQQVNSGPVTLHLPHQRRQLIAGVQGQQGSLMLQVLETAARC